MPQIGLLLVLWQYGRVCEGTPFWSVFKGSQKVNYNLGVPRKKNMLIMETNAYTPIWLQRESKRQPLSASLEYYLGRPSLQIHQKVTQARTSGCEIGASGRRWGLQTVSNYHHHSSA